MAALDRIAAFLPPATVCIFTGGGYQAFWLLREATFDIERVEKVNQAIAARLGGDNCHNIDRIMRLPGTLNVPNAKKKAAGRDVELAFVVSELTDWSRRYSINDFTLPPPSAPAAGALAVPAADVTPAAILPVRVEDVGPALDEYTRRTIELGDDPERPSALTQTDGSGRVWP